MAKILIIEDDQTFSRILSGFLKKENHELEVAHNVKGGIDLLQKHTFDALLLDYRLPDGDGLQVLSNIREQNLSVPAVIMTSFHDIRTVVKTMKAGAVDFITKPVNPDELLMVLNSVLEKKKEKTQPRKTSSLFIEGASERSRLLQDHVMLVAPTEMSVIIQGESGTGKEYIARKIHQLSKRSNAPFVAIDCGAIPKELAESELFGHMKGAFTGALMDKKGQFELANGGTLFLDEIGNLPYEIQVKLLRALQERVIQPLGGTKQINVDVRVIAATNDDLLSSIQNGEFREDLYHRINEFKIKVPPLRERQNDLEIFIDHFRELANKELEKAVTGFSPEVMTAFRNYDWPGNLRELKNVIKRAVLLSRNSVADKDVLPEEMLSTRAKNISGTNLKEHQELNERELIIKTLVDTKYNKSKAARLLNIDRKTLYTKMLKYKIEI